MNRRATDNSRMQRIAVSPKWIIGTMIAAMGALLSAGVTWGTLRTTVKDNKDAIKDVEEKAVKAEARSRLNEEVIVRVEGLLKEMRGDIKILIKESGHE